MNPPHETNEGWEERIAQFTPDDFSVAIYPSTKVVNELGVEEMRRMRPKLEAIAELAQNLALGMLKGNCKYPHDTRSDAEWEAFQRDEKYDSINYTLMRELSRQGRLHDKTGRIPGIQPGDSVHNEGDLRTRPYIG